MSDVNEPVSYSVLGSLNGTDDQNSLLMIAVLVGVLAVVIAGVRVK